MYIHDTTLEQLEYSELTQLYPNSSTPKNGTEVILEVWYLIHDEPLPPIDRYTQVVVSGPVVKTGELYFQTWLVETLSQEDVDTYIATAIDDKSLECELQVERLMDIAYANPAEGAVEVPRRYKRRMSARITDIANKSAGNATLTPKERQQSIVDQRLSNYERRVYRRSDTAIEELEALPTAVEIYAFDVEGYAWDTWVPA